MEKLILFLSIALTLGLLACQNGQQPDNFQQQAVELAHKYIITDGHIDVPYRLRQQYLNDPAKIDDVSRRTEGGDFDYERAKAGGLDAPFMSIYVPSMYQRLGGAKRIADTLINMVVELATTHPDKFALAFSPNDIRRHFEKGIISLPMGMENGAPIEESLDNVAYFHQRGIRYITLTHGKDNQICDSSYDTTRTHNGLSPFGERVVQEMNRVGIMVDISHVSDSAFYDVMKITRAPVIASHSSLRYFTPGFERNMNDDMLLALRDNGGVIMINFGSSFIDSTFQRKSEEMRAHLTQWMQEHKLGMGDPETRAYMQEYREKHLQFPTVEDVANHIDRVVQLIGIDHVGFGSDFDGVGPTLPQGLEDVSCYPNLIRVLLERGYSEADIEKICYKNLFRVWEAVEAVAAQQQSQDAG